MDHITVRRLALSFAAVCFGALTAAVLVCSACITEQRWENQQQGALAFPLPVAGTQLTAQRLSLYDGPFYEDGTGREVFSVAALEVCNPGEKMVLAAQITVKTQSGSYFFDATVIPPGSRVLIPEKNAKPLKKGKLLEVSGWTVCALAGEQPQAVMAEEGGRLFLKNTAETDMHWVKLYHKTYLFDSDLYMGGKAFETVVPYLPAGAQLEIFPKNYAPGYSCVLWVE